MTRWIGVDAGEARTGLAAGDDDSGLAVPLCIIEHKGRSLDNVAAAILARARGDGAGGLVVGLPLNMDGSEGFQARRARSLGRRLGTAGLPMEYWDERMSSYIAEQRTSELPGYRERRRHTDDLAAAVILQSFLDARAARLRPAVPGTTEGTE